MKWSVKMTTYAGLPAAEILNEKGEILCINPKIQEVKLMAAAPDLLKLASELHDIIEIMNDQFQKLPISAFYDIVKDQDFAHKAVKKANFILNSLLEEIGQPHVYRR